MYPTPTPNMPPRRWNDAPVLYPSSPYTAPLAGAHAPVPRPRSYDFSSVQTVESIIARGYLAVPTGDPVTVLLTDRRHTAWLGLDDAIGQIRARYLLYARNMRSILYATAAATNALHTWKAERGWYNERQLDNQHKTLQSLYAQEREERLSLWRDLARVRATFPEIVQQYLSAERKLTLLEDSGGEAP